MRLDSEASGSAATGRVERLPGRDVASVVVTHNRKRLLVENLRALLAQSPAPRVIYLIDNASDDGSRELLEAEGLLPSERGRTGVDARLFPSGPTRLDYVRLEVNRGGAGGFAEGMRRALAGGHDWIWLMDDDALPQPDALALLLEHAEHPDRPVALAGGVWGADGRLQAEHRGRFAWEAFFPLPQRPIPAREYARDRVEIEMASFVGLLVRADAARRIGLPKAEFFLNHDDAEYSLRLGLEGAMWLIPASRILHKDALGVGKTVRRKRFGRVSERVPEARLWFYYFSVRNLVYLARHSLPPLSFLRQLSVYALRQVLGVLVYDNRRGTRLTCLGRALADGFRGRFDNAFPFRLTSRLAERGTRRQQVSE